jgi:carbonic anhydrase
MRTQTKEMQNKLTPISAQKILVEGNNRFIQNLKLQRDLQSQVSETNSGQFPFAVILSCMDSRVPVELIFDQGIGDIFNIKIAGNIINKDILGSLEYACKVAGAKIIVVMGHSNCGAVASACIDTELGNATSLLDKIKPAISIIKENKNEIISNDLYEEEVSIQNVKLSINRIKNESPIISEMLKNKKIGIIGAFYNINTGKVAFFEYLKHDWQKSIIKKEKV